MTRVRLNWVTQISVVACVVACGSSNNNTVGNSATANVGGSASSSSVAGNGANNGGGANNAGSGNKGGGVSNGGNGTSGNGNGTSGNGTSGNGTAGSNSQAGNGSGTGSSGSTTDGGSGGNVGGTGSAGGDGSVGGDYYATIGGNGAGGGSSVDVNITGGTGNTHDFATGGSGATSDFATGGGYTVDTATGGGSTIDTATGGGSTIDTATGGGSTIDTTTGGGSTIDHATGGSTSTDFPKCLKTDLNSINVYVIKDVTAPSGGADTEGNMYVGGNFSSVNYSIGKKDGVVDCSQYSLVVGGTVAGALVYNGKAVTGGTVTNSSDLDCPPGVVQVKTLPVDFASLETKVENLSVALHTQLTPNGTVSGTNPLVLTGTDPNQNVFNITSAQLGSITINVPQTSIVVINVSGTTINWPSGTVTLPGAKGGADSDYLFSSNVIWNFYEATTFFNVSTAIQGTVLAPLATFTGGSGHIAGQVIVRYMTSLSVEYHPYYFSACVIFPTP